MPTTTLTTKGQMTLPKEIRERFRLKAGDRLEVSVQDEHITLTPKTLHLENVASILPKPETALSIDDINEAIAAAAAEPTP